jgi:hypothetical protein
MLDQAKCKSDNKPIREGEFGTFQEEGLEGDE